MVIVRRRRKVNRKLSCVGRVLVLKYPSLIVDRHRLAGHDGPNSLKMAVEEEWIEPAWWDQRHAQVGERSRSAILVFQYQ